MGVTVSFTPGGDGSDPWSSRQQAPECRPPPVPVADPDEDDSPEVSEAARIFGEWLDRTQHP